MANKPSTQKIKRSRYVYSVLGALGTYIISCIILYCIYYMFNFDPDAGVECLMCYGCSCPSGYTWFVNWPAFILGMLVFALIFPKQSKYYKLAWFCFGVVIVWFIFYTINNWDFIYNIININRKWGM